jgi:hypothetical protein
MAIDWNNANSSRSQQQLFLLVKRAMEFYNVGTEAISSGNFIHRRRDCVVRLAFLASIVATLSCLIACPHANAVEEEKVTSRDLDIDGSRVAF